MEHWSALYGWINGINSMGLICARCGWIDVNTVNTALQSNFRELVS